MGSHAEESPPPGRGADRRVWLWLPLLLLGLGWIVGFGSGSGLLDQSYGGPPKWDAGPYTWFLWHFAEAAAGRADFWHSSMLFFPGGLQMVNQDWTPIPGLLALPFAPLGPLAAYNLQFLLAYVLTGCATFWLARRLGASTAFALLACLIFTFCEFRILKAHYHGQPGHAHQEFIPLYLAFVLAYLQTGRRRHALAAGACFFAAVFTTPYQMVFLLFFSLFILLARLWHAAKKPAWPPGQKRVDLPPFLRRAGLFVLLSGGTAALLVAPVLALNWDAFVSGTEVLGASGMRHPADLLSYLGSSLHRTPARFYHYNESWSAFQGYSVMLLGLVAAVLSAAASGARFWLVCGALFFVLSLGGYLMVDGEPWIELPGFLFPALEHLPVLKGARFASRFSSMVTLCLALGAALALTHLEAHRLAGWSEGRRRLLRVAVLVVVGLELVSGQARIALAGSSKHHLRPCGAWAIMGRDPRPSTLLTYPLIWETRNRVWGPHLFPRQRLVHQTVHRKRLLTGLGDAIDDATINRYLTDPLLGHLFRLQNGFPLPPTDDTASAAAQQAARKLNIGYVVLQKNPRSLSPLSFTGSYNTAVARQFLEAVLPLRKLYEDPELVLFGLSSSGAPETP